MKLREWTIPRTPYRLAADCWNAGLGCVTDSDSDGDSDRWVKRQATPFSPGNTPYVEWSRRDNGEAFRGGRDLGTKVGAVAAVEHGEGGKFKARVDMSVYILVGKACAYCSIFLSLQYGVQSTEYEVPVVCLSCQLQNLVREISIFPSISLVFSHPLRR